MLVIIITVQLDCQKQCILQVCLLWAMINRHLFMMYGSQYIFRKRQSRVIYVDWYKNMIDLPTKRKLHQYAFYPAFPIYIVKG